MDITVYRKQTNKITLRVTPTGRVHVTAPEGMPLPEIKKFVDSRKGWLNEALGRAQERVNHKDAFYSQLPLSTPAEIDDAINRLEALVPPIVSRYEAIMGVRPACLIYRPTTSRWGSCNVETRVITFSVYVLLLPEWCVEHVVVHEMCHLLVPNHGPEFHALMDKYFPRWREARKETLRICRMEP